MNQKFEALTNAGDVISVQDKSMHSYLASYPMFKMAEITKILSCKVINIHEQSWDDESYGKPKKWVTEGVDCEVLSISEGKWKSGKVRVKVLIEFCPDESGGSQSPLDDLR
ncbi:KGK domain-containing protein [Spirulina major]|uniref:KGK domain-containing protein n=1 Tax=Spirulina major TaxID=270636 RepID=UPI00093483F7|nr:KGK domain-containing protein [Spirulina major]